MPAPVQAPQGVPVEGPPFLGGLAFLGAQRFWVAQRF
jgi:hypothetical protein